MPPRTRRLIYLLFLLSGGTALVYQVTWVRDLSLIFGASFQAASIVLASFMAGLALGGFCFGRLAGRLRRPLAVYAGLELGVAVLRRWKRGV
jgi:MFS family permease